MDPADHKMIPPTPNQALQDTALPSRPYTNPESFVRGVSTLTAFFFSLIGGGMIQIPLLLAGHHQPASKTPFKWHFAGMPIRAQHCWLDRFVIFQGIRTSIAKKRYIFVIFHGRSGPPVPPSGSAHV